MGKRCKRRQCHTYNVHARRDGLVLSARRCKNGQKTGVQTPVFQLEKGSAAFSQAQNIFAAREYPHSQNEQRTGIERKFREIGKQITIRKTQVLRRVLGKRAYFSFFSSDKSDYVPF